MISKAAEAYPIHLVDPSLDPQFIFCYPHTLRGGCIEHYLHSQRPFDPQIEQHEGYIEMNVRSTDNDGSPVWVFPDSGVVYTWNQ
ncbi:MAG: hypothetical protein IH872_01395 [Chloroflexi bacterium]|nr:hypothetical protein [Chloroflexota bacterium]